MKRLWWLAAVMPLLVGLFATLLLNGLKLGENPVLFVRVDAGTFTLFLGICLTLLSLTLLYIYQRGQTQLAHSQTQSEAIRQQFLRRLDHELKNPLTAIMAGLANLAYAKTPTEQAETVASVQTQVQRMRRLVADLRKLSDLETRSLEQSPVNLTQLLEDVFALAQDHPNAPERQLSASIPRAPWGLSTLSGDQDLLFLAVYNLLDNALKFTKKGDVIELRAIEANNRVTIEVADTGQGIPERELSEVWYELYRGRAARGIPGSGLGLALVRAIITRHAGTLDLRSRQNEGTVFTIHLPVTNS